MDSVVIQLILKKHKNCHVSPQEGYGLLRLELEAGGGGAAEVGGFWGEVGSVGVRDDDAGEVLGHQLLVNGAVAGSLAALLPPDERPLAVALEDQGLALAEGLDPLPERLVLGQHVRFQQRLVVVGRRGRWIVGGRRRLRHIEATQVVCILLRALVGLDSITNYIILQSRRSLVKAPRLKFQQSEVVLLLQINQNVQRAINYFLVKSLRILRLLPPIFNFWLSQYQFLLFLLGLADTHCCVV